MDNKTQFYGALITDAGDIVNPDFRDYQGFETREEVEDFLNFYSYTEIEPGIYRAQNGDRFKIVEA